MSKQRTEPPSAGRAMLFRMLKSGLFGFAVSMALLLIAALLFASGFLNADWVPAVAVIACIIGGIIAGLRAVRGQSNYRLWLSMAAGFTLFVLLYLLGAVLFGRIAPATNSLPILLSVLGGGVGGGFIANLRQSKRPKHRMNK